MRTSKLALVIISTAIQLSAQVREPNEWRIMPSLKFDTFYFLNAISNETHYNRLYQRECIFWRARLGSAVVDTINAINDSISSIGFKASYLFAFVPASTLGDVIDALENPTVLEQSIQSALVASNDLRYEASMKDLKRILGLRVKLLYVLRRMQEEGWEDDWKAIATRLAADIRRKQSELTQYSPQFLRAEALRFLGIDADQKDSSSTIYYLYYSFPNAFKLPYNMMAIWSIEEPKYFFPGYLHEMLHLFSIYAPQFINFHNNLLKGSRQLRQQREILVKQLFESDDEFYILAAEAYLTVRLGIRTHEQAVDYLKDTNGGTVIYSLLIYDYLTKHFDYRHHSFGSFLKDVFFRDVTSKDVERFIADRK